MLKDVGMEVPKSEEARCRTQRQGVICNSMHNNIKHVLVLGYEIIHVAC